MRDECSFGICAIYVEVRVQGNERERASWVYRNWAVSILLCRRTSGCQRNEKNIFIKMLFSNYRPPLFISFAFLVSVRAPLMGLIKQGSGVSTFTLQTRPRTKQHLGFATGLLGSMYPCQYVYPALLIHPALKKDFFLKLYACQSDLLRTASCLNGSPSYCLSVNVFFCVNPSFQRQDMKS